MRYSYVHTLNNVNIIVCTGILCPQLRSRVKYNIHKLKNNSILTFNFKKILFNAEINCLLGRDLQRKFKYRNVGKLNILLHHQKLRPIYATAGYGLYVFDNCIISELRFPPTEVDSKLNSIYCTIKTILTPAINHSITSIIISIRYFTF